MTLERWQQIKGIILDNFSILEQKQEKLESSGGEQVEILEFMGPLGKMRIEFWTRPVIIGKNVSGSRRIGSHHEVEYLYSETEKINVLILYKWDDNQSDWVEVDLQNYFNL